MKISGERTIPAAPSVIWDLMLEPDALRQAIAGCERLDKVSETEFDAAVTVKVGPVKARFAGRVELQDIDEPKSCVLSGQGSGGVAGFAKGTATIVLSPMEDGCMLSYEGNIDIGGKIASLGDRLFKLVVTRNVDHFFDQIVARVREAG